ncbi:sulfotransferase family 2 domain-containing protein [Algiphilus aromaticivorans]|uniref:sulfotransferase family 2 domain-containing protein n=1 Tax=Algiphilus aromaticivorans TaxID=382454 RepID=UPI000A06BE45|nr:sulfotransferase family 2 domain-containing protein [Algiphilus aromaticivorans]
MNNRTIVFLHVPKAAGATLRKQLLSIYGAGHVFWFRPGHVHEDREKLKKMDSVERSALKAVTGHIRFGFVDRFLRQPLAYITLLRDPIERIRSYYQFVLDTPSHPHHAVSREKDLAGFAGSDIPGLHDLQTRMISGKTGHRLIGKDVYELAEENLAQFALVGVQERYGDFLQRLALWAGWQELAPVESVHQVSQRADVSNAARDVILERNRWDLALHERARGAWVKDDPV